MAGVFLIEKYSGTRAWTRQFTLPACWPQWPGVSTAILPQQQSYSPTHISLGSPSSTHWHGRTKRKITDPQLLVAREGNWLLSA